MKMRACTIKALVIASHAQCDAGYYFGGSPPDLVTSTTPPPTTLGFPPPTTLGFPPPTTLGSPPPTTIGSPPPTLDFPPPTTIGSPPPTTIASPPTTLGFPPPTTGFPPPSYGFFPSTPPLAAAPPSKTSPPVTLTANGTIIGPPICTAISGWLITDYYLSQGDPLWDNVAVDKRSERGLLETLGDAGYRDRIKSFRERYFNETDVNQMKNSGISCLKVMIGYWTRVYTQQPPQTGLASAMKEVNDLLTWADKHGLEVTIQLYSHKGCQSLGGITNCETPVVSWGKDDSVQDSTDWAIGIVNSLKQYRSFTALELMHEPDQSIDQATLRKFYTAVTTDLLKSSNVKIILPVQESEITKVDLASWCTFRDTIGDKRVYISKAAFLQYVVNPIDVPSVEKIVNDRCGVYEACKDQLQISGWGMYLPHEIRDIITKQAGVETAKRIFKLQLDCLTKLPAYFFYNWKAANDETKELDIYSLRSWLTTQAYVITSGGLNNYQTGIN